MSARGNHSYTPETGPNGIGPEKIGRSTFDDNWKPGDPDPFTDEVKKASDPLRPGIAPKRRMVDIGGMFISEEQARQHGFIDE